MNKLLFLFSGIFLLAYSGCIKKVGKPTSSGIVVNCDNITFNKSILPIIQRNCAIAGCHVAGFSSGDYTTYAGLNNKVANGKFKARVFDANPGPMPAAGKLPPAVLDSIKCWLDKGAPNN